MSKEYNLSPFFKRRIDHHKFEKLMRKGISYMYFESKNLEQFKYKLVKATLENYVHYKYNIDIDDLPDEDVDNFIDYMIDTYEPVLKMYYYNERKNRGEVNESNNTKLSDETLTETFQEIINQTMDEFRGQCDNLENVDYDESLMSNCEIIDSIDKITITNIKREKSLGTRPMFSVDVNLTFNSVFEWVDYDDIMYEISNRILSKWKVHLLFDIKEQENSNKREMWEYARTLKNARHQGSKVNFPKSAIKTNPMRFRPYSR